VDSRQIHMHQTKNKKGELVLQCKKKNLKDIKKLNYRLLIKMEASNAIKMRHP